jgi:hypothetical protein
MSKELRGWITADGDLGVGMADCGIGAGRCENDNERSEVGVESSIA